MKKKDERKKIIEKYILEHPPTYTEGHWDEAMLEDNSYYDIDIINKANAPIFRKIEEWETKYAHASSNMGKWYCQLQIDKWKNNLKKYQ